MAQSGFKNWTRRLSRSLSPRDQKPRCAGLVQTPGRRLLLAGSAHDKDGLVMGAAVRHCDVSSKSTDGPACHRFEHRSAGPGRFGWGRGLGLICGRTGHSRQISFPSFPPGCSGTMAAPCAWILKIKRFWSKQAWSTARVFSDLDGDGDPDLILAGKWGYRSASIEMRRQVDGMELTPSLAVFSLPQPSTLSPQPVDRLVEQCRDRRF